MHHELSCSLIVAFLNKVFIDRRIRPQCCHLWSYFKRPKSSPVRPLACNWYYCAQFIAKPKAACALRFSWAATLRTEPRPYVISTQILLKIERAVPKIWPWRDERTHTHTHREREREIHSSQYSASLSGVKTDGNDRLQYPARSPFRKNIVYADTECEMYLVIRLPNVYRVSKIFVKRLKYTVSQKRGHLTLAHNFTKYWPIFKILSLLDSVGNL